MTLPKVVKSWAWYDFANSAYILLYSSFLLPAFFSTVLLGKGYPLTTWGLANGVSTLLGVALAVVGGSFADRRGKIETLRMAVWLTFLGMVLLSVASVSFYAAVLPIFIATQAVFIFTLSLSDSILPHLSQSSAAYRFSGFAWGVGYVGGILSLVIAMILQSLTSEFSVWVFLSGAFFYLLFSLLALNGLSGGIDLPQAQVADLSMNPRQKARFLVGFWLISECITVFILFFNFYSSQELGLSTLQIGMMLLLIQMIACPATILGGRWAQGRAVKRIFLSSMLSFMTAMLIFLLPASVAGVVIVCVLGGLAIGNSQSILRAHYARVVPMHRSGVEFGFYSFVSQAAVILGPVLYGAASDALDSQKIPLVVLVSIMAVGTAMMAPMIKSGGEGGI